MNRRALLAALALPGIPPAAPCGTPWVQHAETIDEELLRGQLRVFAATQRPNVRRAVVTVNEPYARLASPRPVVIGRVAFRFQVVKGQPEGVPAWVITPNCEPVL